MPQKLVYQSRRCHPIFRKTLTRDNVSQAGMTDGKDKLGLGVKIDKVHCIVTEKRGLDGIEFDAWYTDTDYVLRCLLDLGKAVARDLRQGRLQWNKQIPDALSESLKKRESLSLIGRMVLMRHWQEWQYCFQGGLQIRQLPKQETTPMTAFCNGSIVMYGLPY